MKNIEAGYNKAIKRNGKGLKALAAYDAMGEVKPLPPANEVPQVELLERDIGIMLTEVRRIREENERLDKLNKKLAEENRKLKNGGELRAVKEELHRLKKAAENAEKEDLAFYIKNQREAMGISRGEMSRRLNMVDQTLANYEKGKGSIEGMNAVIDAIREMRRGKSE